MRPLPQPARGRQVSPHVFPEIHVHLAAALPNVIGIETVDPRSGISPISQLVEPLEIRGGTTAPPQSPGIGLVFDRDALEHYRRP